MYQHIFTMLGTKPENYPTPDETMKLVVYTKANMSRFSMRDIVNGFTLCIQQKLDHRVSAFDRVSPMMLELVMQSYARFRFTYIDKPVDQLPEPEVDGQKIIIEDCVNSFNQYKKTGRLIDFGSVKFRFLEGIGAIVIPLERKQEIYALAEDLYVTEEVQAHQKHGTMREATKKGLFNIGNPTIKQQVVEKARWLALKEYFDNLKEMDEDIELLIKDLI